MQDSFETLKALKVVKSFVKYIDNKDFANIDFITDDGVYYIQNNKTLRLIKVDKNRFKHWLIDRIKRSDSLRRNLLYLRPQIELTTKNEVLLVLNNGFFPFIPKRNSGKSLGLIIRAKNNKIIKIKPTKVDSNVHLLQTDDYIKSLWNTVYYNKRFSYYKTIDMHYNCIPVDPYC